MFISLCPLLMSEIWRFSPVPYEAAYMLPCISCNMACTVNLASHMPRRSSMPGYREAVSYIVKPGDSLYKIALEYNTTVDALKKANKLSGDLIYPGQYLVIPALILPDGIYNVGSRGGNVTRIQQALAKIGFPIPITGYYGQQTKGFIASIQMKYPELKVDGIYGPKTKPYIQRLLDINYHIVKNPESLLTLVNKLNALLAYYVPSDLTVPNAPFNFEGFLPKRQMRKAAAEALEELFAGAKASNITLAGVSGYRSYERQAEIFSGSYKEDPDHAVKFSARPGESEHQTGLAIDVSGPSVNYKLSQSLGDKPEGQWLRQNAPRFGFIIRYPRGKENITGYQYEPWHIRYVGIPAAQEISRRGITLEEYLGK